ncbi:ABC-type spermidine/putrescine transport system permease subunit II [Bradyrhizobium liaoningense]
MSMAADERNARAPWALTAPALMLFVGVLLIPLAMTVMLSFHDWGQYKGIEPVFILKNWHEIATDPYYAEMFWRTFRVAILTTLLTALLGAPEAYILNRMSGRWKSFFLLVILGPLLISVVARTLGWALLFGGNNGLVNKLLMSLGVMRSPIPFMFTETGMIIALAHVMMPFMVLSVWAALQRLDPQIENAAMSLGAGPVTIIRRIVMPQILPGVLSGAIIVFSLSASAFATPAIIGGRRLKVAATLAYDEFLNTLNWPLGAAVATLLLVGRAGADRRRQQRVDRATLRGGVPMRRNGPLALIFHAIFVIVMVAPILVVCLVAFTPEGFLSLPTNGFSLRWFRTIANYPEFIHAFWVSLGLGALSSFVALLFAVPAALAIARYRFRGRDALAALFLSPLMIPHVVLGIAFLRFFTSAGLGGSFAALIIAHVIIVFPFALRLTLAAATGMDRTVEMAAVSLGAGGWTLFRRVTLPLILPGVISGWALAFIQSFDDLTMTVFLATPGTETLPVRMFLYIQDNIDPLVTSVSACVIAITMTALILLDRFYGLDRVLAGKGDTGR